MVEAHDNLASVHVAEGGVVTLVTTESQAEALDVVVRGLETSVLTDPPPVT